MTKIDRPDYCCGVCPELLRGGYDCTCEGNPRCQKSSTVDLQEVLDLDAQATSGPWGADVDPEGANDDWWVLLRERRVIADLLDGRNAELIAHYRTAAPAMAKALQAALDLHVMYWDGSRQEYVCRACQHPARWPSNTCPTVQSIHEHLGGQE